jgi:hypothetical protein
MAKRKITVTVDEELVDLSHALGEEATLSGVVNDALKGHVERLGRRAALREQLIAWDEAFGPVSEQAREEARVAFDEVDALAIPRLLP